MSVGNAGDIENAAIATAYLRMQGVDGAEASITGDQMNVTLSDLSRTSGSDIFSVELKKLLRFAKVRLVDVADKRRRHIYYVVSEDRVTSDRP